MLLPRHVCLFAWGGERDVRDLKWGTEKQLNIFNRIQNIGHTPRRVTLFIVPLAQYI